MTEITDDANDSKGPPPPPPLFDGDDRECVRAILAGLGVRGFVLEGGLDLLLDEWRSLVARVEQGTTCELYAFLSKLSIRTLLERVLDRVPPFLAKRMRTELAPLDQRWRNVTKINEDFLGEPRLQKRFDPERYFWLYGQPATLRLE